MRDATTFVGLDVHKREIFVSIVGPWDGGSREMRIANQSAAVRKLAKRLREGSAGSLRCCYEAGPCGYTVQRRFAEEGVECSVVAPSLIPVKPGQRIKTDRRDARRLAELLRGDELTSVRVPTPAEEAVRDLSRAREDVREDLGRCRHRLTKLLLRRGLSYSQGRAWTQAHRAWLRAIELDHPAERVVLADYLLAIEHQEARLRELEARLKEAGESEPYRDGVAALRCFRGIDTITAITLLAEIHDIARFASARALMAYLGLVPSEHSSGERVHRGSITKTGNSHARRVLIEAAWHYRHRPGVGLALNRRRHGQPPWLVAIADRAQIRLNRTYTRMVLQKTKPPNKAVVAVARELVGFIWAVLLDSRALSNERTRTTRR